MRPGSLDRANVLEAGFLVLALGIGAGISVLVVGGLVGKARRSQRHEEDAPVPGSVPAERHQHYASSPR
ncbi:MAG: hypothetical protein JO023_12040 [Chloroflexi bacterium]|nr:hypothetical protein [Chloroflexota bacterium]